MFAFTLFLILSSEVHAWRQASVESAEVHTDAAVRSTDSQLDTHEAVHAAGKSAHSDGNSTCDSNRSGSPTLVNSLHRPMTNVMQALVKEADAKKFNIEIDDAIVDNNHDKWVITVLAKHMELLHGSRDLMQVASHPLLSEASLLETVKTKLAGLEAKYNGWLAKAVTPVDECRAEWEKEIFGPVKKEEDVFNQDIEAVLKTSADATERANVELALAAEKTVIKGEALQNLQKLEKKVVDDSNAELKALQKQTEALEKVVKSSESKGEKVAKQVMQASQNACQGALLGAIGAHRIKSKDSILALSGDSLVMGVSTGGTVVLMWVVLLVAAVGSAIAKPMAGWGFVTAIAAGGWTVLVVAGITAALVAGGYGIYRIGVYMSQKNRAASDSLAIAQDFVTLSDGLKDTAKTAKQVSTAAQKGLSDAKMTIDQIWSESKGVEKCAEGTATGLCSKFKKSKKDQDACKRKLEPELKRIAMILLR